MYEELYGEFFSTLKLINSNIPKKELTKAKDVFSFREIKKGDFFIKAGEIPGCIAFNVSGLFRYYYINSNGVEFTKHFCLKNNFIASYSSILLSEESKFFIEAMEDSKILVADFKLWEKLLDSHFCWQVLARKIIENVYIMMEKRESRLLLEDAKTRYIKFLKEYPMLKDRVKQYHIASYLGINPVTLSRIRSKLDFD